MEGITSEGKHPCRRGGSSHERVRFKASLLGLTDFDHLLVELLRPRSPERGRLTEVALQFWTGYVSAVLAQYPQMMHCTQSQTPLDFPLVRCLILPFPGHFPNSFHLVVGAYKSRCKVEHKARSIPWSKLSILRERSNNDPEA